MTKSYAKDFEDAGGKVFLNCSLTNIKSNDNSKFAVQLECEKEKVCFYNIY